MQSFILKSKVVQDRKNKFGWKISQMIIIIQDMDESWKWSDKFSGIWWFCISATGKPPTMGATNLRRSLFSLHIKVEALLWRWSVWSVPTTKIYKFLRTVQTWWRLCFLQQNGRRSHLIWKNYRARRKNSQTFLYP